MDKNVKTALIVGGIALTLLITVPLIWGGLSGWGWGMMGPWMMGCFGWMWLMPLFGIVFLGLIIWAIVSLVRGSDESGSQDSSKEDSALEVLKRRYARGEIDKQEYEEKKKELV